VHWVSSAAPEDGVSASFDKSRRLLNAADYSRVFEGADARASHRHLLLLATANHHSQHRLGLVIAKKSVRQAVQRNRIKRLSREFFRKLSPEDVNFDVVLLSRRGLDDLDNAQVSSILRQQWQKLLRNASSTERSTRQAN
jgi:ribonuclease P protein component